MFEKLKAAYLLWHQYRLTLPKTERYSLGEKIDQLAIDGIEAVSVAAFLSREEKAPYVRLAIRKIDTAKVLLMILWETKSLDTKRYIALSEKIAEVGRMLGGWNGQLAKSIEQTRDKQNSPAKAGEK